MWGPSSMVTSTLFVQSTLYPYSPRTEPKIDSSTTVSMPLFPIDQQQEHHTSPPKGHTERAGPLCRLCVSGVSHSLAQPIKDYSLLSQYSNARTLIQPQYLTASWPSSTRTAQLHPPSWLQSLASRAPPTHRCSTRSSLARRILR